MSFWVLLHHVVVMADVHVIARISIQEIRSTRQGQE